MVSFAADAAGAHVVNTGRRHFLRGRFGAAGRAALRPPWAVPEPGFLAACTRCGQCARACAAGIIVRGDGGYPEVSFAAGECTFCGACATACTPRALSPGGIPWQLQPTIASSCLQSQDVLCRSCGDACPQAAIRFAPRAAGASVQVAPACNGCGACVRACPVSAITMQHVCTHP